MMKHYRFRQAAEQVAEEIQLTKVMAICYQTDIEMHLQMGKKGLCFFRETDEPLQRLSHLLHKKIHFSQIAKIEWTENETDSIIVLFSSSGRVFQSGVITFFSLSGEKFSYQI